MNGSSTLKVRPSSGMSVYPHMPILHADPTCS